MRMWGARLGDHSAGTARQGAGDAAEVHFHPSSPPRPARSLPLPQTALQPPAAVRAHSPAARLPAAGWEQRRLRGNRVSSRPNASGKPQHGLRKLSELNALPGDWLRAAPIPRFPCGAGLSAAAPGAHLGVLEVGSGRLVSCWLVR